MFCSLGTELFEAGVFGVAASGRDGDPGNATGSREPTLGRDPPIVLKAGRLYDLVIGMSINWAVLIKKTCWATSVPTVRCRSKSLRMDRAAAQRRIEQVTERRMR